MAETPKRAVHWNFDDMSFSDLNSPGGSTDSYVSTSTLEYANSQLLAHGYTDRPGLCLDGISSKDSDAVVKCLLKLLGDRMADMSRTEELTTKLRTLSYEHDRLGSMHRSANEKAANAEREASMHKSKLAATLRTLSAAESAHKLTSAELQRTRTSLQAIRSTHQAEMKKREKEVERLTEKWQKIADIQSKISSTPSGLVCANVAAIEGRGLLNSSTFLESALEESERARAGLLEDNNYLKALLLKAVNSIQRIDYQTKCLLADKAADQEPTPFTVSTLFPMAPATHSAETLSLLLIHLRNSLESVSEQLANPPTGDQDTNDREAQNARAMNAETRRLQTIIENLQNELDRCHAQLERQTQEITTLYQEVAEHQRNAAQEIAEISVELDAAPLRNEEKERLERLRDGLEQERQKLSDAAAQFGKEKASLEAERRRFMDEKENWEMEKVITERPPSPARRAASPIRMKKASKQSPRKGAFRSPKKAPPKKPAPRVKQSGATHTSLGSPKRIIPAGETEIIPPLPSLNFSAASNEKPLAASLLSTAFVLPPPSPFTSLPSAPDFTVADLDAPPSDDDEPPAPQPNPKTPPDVRKPFPVAKPFAQRMVHAYSPAKPSPLSRILMLANTPGAGKPMIAAPDLSGINEEESTTPTDPHDPFPRIQQQPAMSLAAELGVSDSPPDTPLQEKKLAPNIVPSSKQMKGRSLFPAVRKPPVAPTAREKGKMRAVEPVAASGTGSRKAGGGSLTKTGAAGQRTKRVGEKENSEEAAGETLENMVLSFKSSSPVFKAPSAGSNTGRPVPAGVTIATTRRKAPSPASSTAVEGSSRPTGSKATATSRGSSGATARTAPLNVATKGGPRRVPIDSAEAPPVKKRG